MESFLQFIFLGTGMIGAGLAIVVMKIRKIGMQVGPNPIKCLLGFHDVKKGHCLRCDYVDFGHWSKF